MNSSAGRIASLLTQHPLMRASGVVQVAVFPRLDGLGVQTVLDDGSVQAVTLNLPTWYPEFRQNEAAFVDSVAAALPRRLPESLWDRKGELDLQCLFLRVIDDLNRVSASNDDYDNLRIAPLLRLLLLDGQPLIHRVNRTHRLPVVFYVGDVLVNDVVDDVSKLPPSDTPRLVKTVDGRLFHAVGRRFDPQTSQLMPQELTLDEFLGALVMKVEDHWVTVRELVKHMAHVEGLAHAGGPGDDEVDASLLKWRRMLQFSGAGATLETLAAIGRVVCSSQVALAFECSRSLQQGLSIPDGDAVDQPGPGQ